MLKSTNTRYVLYPGFVTSRNDGDLHYIDVQTLRYLYDIPRTAVCVVYDKSMVIHDNDIQCRPRYDGKYPIFKTKER